MIPQNDHHLPCYQKQPFWETNHYVYLMACSPILVYFVPFLKVIRSKYGVNFGQ